MAFRFVHNVDIHLDSPLRSLAMRNPELSGIVGDASRWMADVCLRLPLIKSCLSPYGSVAVIARGSPANFPSRLRTPRIS
ncbi:hypothetical protein FS827_23570 [Agrobacterium vitis]|nr:hypothetical protein [Allorhizobium ampelinum]